MRIDRCMRHPVLTVKPHDSVQRARGIMEERRVNQLPVVIDDRVVGIVTDRDVRDAFPSVFDHTPRRSRPRVGAADPATIALEDVMSPNVLTLGPEGSVEEAARLMRRERIGAIPIVIGERLVGIITRSDVLDAFLALAGEGARAAS